MNAVTMEISGSHIPAIKEQVNKLQPVLSATQVGVHLRVLLDTTLPQPEQWLTEQLSSFGDTLIKSTEPNIEDVFVMATRDNESVG